MTDRWRADDGNDGDRERITVLIVDDHSMVAESFRRALDLEDDLDVVGVAPTAADAKAVAAARQPDVVLMDYALPDGDGVATAAAIVRERPATKVIVVTGSDAVTCSAAPSRRAGHTVRTHVQSILAKLGVHSKLEAATFARDNGLVTR